MIYSFSTFGYEGNLIQVETDIRRGIPAIDIVGLAESQIKETRERIKVAFLNSGIDFPTERVLMSLSPCDIRKEGASLDLPMALSVITANENKVLPSDVMAMGEVELSGNIRSVKGISAAISTAISSGIKYFIIPSNNMNEVQKFKGIKVLKAESLKDVYSKMYDKKNYQTIKELSEDIDADEEEINGVCFTNKEGFENPYFKTMNPRLLKALVIAISGHHHLIGYGGVGNGKTMTTQNLPFLLPRMTMEESNPVTRIYSLSGLVSPSENWRKYPPFRMPHQTASIEGICGGGINCRPGEISLAHNGVLFFDEMAEFRSSVIQMLRVPMESGNITLSRAGRSTTYPSDFTFIGMTNPCPCGNFGSKTRICLCSARSIEQYWRKFSAPLLDRCILINTDKLCSEEEKNSYTLKTLRTMVANATVIQRRNGKYNGKLTPMELAEIISKTSNEVRSLAESLTENFSERRKSLLWKVALTVANIDNREILTVEDIKESLELVKDVGFYDLINREIA